MVKKYDFDEDDKMGENYYQANGVSENLRTFGRVDSVSNHLINELPYPDRLLSNDKSDIFSDEESKTGVDVMSTVHYLSQKSNNLDDDISSINQEIIKNKTNSSQTLGVSPFNNLTKDHVITDGHYVFIYHCSTVIGFSSEKYSDSTGHLVPVEKFSVRMPMARLWLKT